MFDGPVFYKDRNNGITAIVTEKTYHEIEAWRRRRSKGTENEPYPGPIFTFYAGTGDIPPWVTGDISMMRRLTARARNVFEGSISIPFSNQELCNMSYEEIREYLQEWQTTAEQLIEAFGLILPGEVNSLVIDGEYVDPYTRNVTGEVFHPADYPQLTDDSLAPSFIAGS